LAAFREAARAEVVAEAEHADGDLGVDGIFRDAELLRDLAVREAVKFAEGQHAAAAFGESLDGLGEQLKFLIMTGGLGDTGPIIKDGQKIDFCYTVDGDNFAAAKIIEGGVARGREEVGLGGTERRLFAGLEEAGVGLLHEVVDIEVRGEFRAKVGA
jgi:hypothetical protein